MLAHLSTLFVLLVAATAVVPEKCGSRHPILTLDPINYSTSWRYSTPAHVINGGTTVSFTLQNDEVDYATTCTGSEILYFGEFGDFMVFNCTNPENKDWEPTSFTYNSHTEVVAVNTTWDCGVDPSVVYAVNVAGRVPTWECERKEWKNPDWKLGEIYSSTDITCESGPLSFQV